jgi:hypothetical protein
MSYRWKAALEADHWILVGMLSDLILNLILCPGSTLLLSSFTGVSSESSQTISTFKLLTELPPCSETESVVLLLLLSLLLLLLLLLACAGVGVGKTSGVGVGVGLGVAVGVGVGCGPEDEELDEE